MNFVGWIKSKKQSLVVIAIVITMVVGTTVVSSTVTANAATIDYYKVKIGDKVIAKVESNEEAKEIINKVVGHYTVEDAKVLSVDIKPAIKVEPAQYEKYGKKPNFDKNIKKVSDKILTGEKTVKEIKVKDGDSIWSIARAENTYVEQLLSDNNMKEDDIIKAGDIIKIIDQKPLVKVTIVKELTRNEAIKYETKEEEKADMDEGKSEVKTKGEDGLKKVTSKVTTENGKEVSEKVLSSKVIKEPVTEVVYKGTKEVEDNTELRASSVQSRSSNVQRRTVTARRQSAPRRTYNPNPPAGRSGSNVVSYALQWVGRTPYVYGGKSLTSGADCSGFVYRVLADCGVNVGYRSSYAWANYGTPVSLSQARPGDVVVYPHHLALYIGGGRVVHSMNPVQGTRVTGINATGYYTSIRRI